MNVPRSILLRNDEPDQVEVKEKAKEVRKKQVNFVGDAVVTEDDLKPIDHP